MRTDPDSAENIGADADQPAADHGDADVPERAGQTHLWFMADSPAGPVFVAHSNGWVTGLLIARDERKPDPGRFVDYMRDEVDRDVEPDPDPDPKLVARVGEALATGRTDVPVDLSSRSPFHQEGTQGHRPHPSGRGPHLRGAG